MAETSLLHMRFLRFPSSLIATSICVYTLLALSAHDCFPATLAALSFYSFEELRECLLELRRAHERIATHTLSTVYLRYIKMEHLRVAALPVPSVMIPSSMMMARRGDVQ